MILDKIASPMDLKDCSVRDLQVLCEELRSEIIRLTYKNGGHLGSNLGVVELTVALHYVFDIPVDKLIFDVGHQSYAHKLLTGRRDIMENLREKNGASGFTDPIESEYDSFISGHASTSLSAALGMAKARDLQKHNYNIISMVGDGSMSGGMTFEAINNLENTKNFIIILNDNQMSISKTVGGMRKYLTQLLASKNMLHARKIFSHTLSKIPLEISQVIKKILKYPLTSFKEGTLFENLGIQYLGPLDGHDLGSLIKILNNVKEQGGYKPILIHAITQKGRGYGPAEQDTYKLHGVAETRSNDQSFTSVFGEEIIRMAETNDKIVCITAAMTTGCGLSEFANKFPNRFFDVGIAEEHATTFAAGLAISGYSPFLCMYSTFLQRAVDQIYHDIVLQNLPVRFIVDKAGLPGRDGKTHSGIYDIAILSMFHNMRIYAPSNLIELKDSLEFASTYNAGPIAIRFPKSPITKEFSISKNKSNTLILTVGVFSESIHKNIDADIISIFQLQPIEFDKLVKLANNYNKIILLEEGIYGGFSANFLNLLHKHQSFEILSKIKILNISKTPVSHSSRLEQVSEAGISNLDVQKLLN